MTAKHPAYRIPSCLDLELFDRVAIFYCDAYYIWRATGGALQKEKEKEKECSNEDDVGSGCASI